jgi:hypothetical protein
MLLYNGKLLSASPTTFLGLGWQNFQCDTRVLMQSNSEAFTKLSSYPDGYNPHKSLIPPRTAGAMRGNPYTEFGITGTGTIYGGITTTSDPGNIDISISTNTPAGELVSTVPAGGAPATFGIDTNAPLLTASIGGDGTATFGMTFNTPILGALGGMTVTATFSMDGTLTSHAIGIMEGTTADSGVTIDNIVQALEAAILPVNIVQVNEIEVTGDGQSGTEWGPI